MKIAVILREDSMILLLTTWDENDSPPWLRRGQGWLSFADRPTHHPLPLLPLRRGVIFMEAKDLQFRGEQMQILRFAQNDRLSSAARDLRSSS